MNGHDLQIVAELLNDKIDDFKAHVTKECAVIGARLEAHVKEDREVHKRVDFHDAIFKIAGWGVGTTTILGGLVVSILAYLK